MAPEKLEGVKITIIYVELALLCLILIFGFVGKTEFVRRTAIGGLMLTAIFMSFCLYQPEIGPIWVVISSFATLFSIVTWAITSLFTE